jgi:hypothetical protein
MDRLWALKKEFDPLSTWIVHGAEFVSLLSLFGGTLYVCPYCRWPIKATWGRRSRFIGAGERLCWHCNQAFRDWSVEWMEMSVPERTLFLLPLTMKGIVGGFVLVLVAQAWVVFVLKWPMDFDYQTFFLALGTPIALGFAFRGWQIVTSVRRYNHHREMRNA